MRENITPYTKLLMATRRALRHSFPMSSGSQSTKAKRQPPSVTLGLYFQMETDQFLLVSPWNAPIECEVSWYKHLEGKLDKSNNPIFVEHVSYQGSRLLHAQSNTIAMDMPAPATWKISSRHKVSSFITSCHKDRYL